MAVSPETPGNSEHGQGTTQSPDDIQNENSSEVEAARFESRELHYFYEWDAVVVVWRRDPAEHVAPAAAQYRDVGPVVGKREGFGNRKHEGKVNRDNHPAERAISDRQRLVRHGASQFRFGRAFDHCFATCGSAKVRLPPPD